MPTYDYRCPNCRHEFSKFHKMSAKGRPKCPECGTPAERQITGGAGVHFKGSGFYITDYKKADKADKADKGGKTGETGKTDKTAESAESGAKSKRADSPKKGADS